MAEPLINRVYDLRIAGFDDSIKKVEELTIAFKAMDEAKTKLNAHLQQKLSAGDDSAVTQLTQKIKELEAEMAKLKSQRDSSAKEAALLAKAEKDTAAALLLTEKATIATATAEKIRAQTVISQNIDRQKQLDLEEKQRIKLEAEKKAVDALEGSYALLKKQRQELESLTGKGNQTSTVTFNNQSFTQSEAIAKIKEMKAQELAYTEQLKIEKTVHDQINKSTTENQTLVDGREKILQLRAQQEEEQKLLALENERLATEKKIVETGTFDIQQGSGQAGNRGIINQAPQVQAFIPANDLERNILLLVKTKEALAGIQLEQKNLKQQLNEGTISQNEFDSAIVKATQIELEFKKTIAATNAEIKATSNIDATVAGSIKNLEALNKALSIQRDAIPVVAPTAGEAEEVKAINAELDKNNELIRINKDLLAQQKINIGNYAGSFKSALTILETELTSINNKLSTGGLGGAQVDELTKKQSVLTSAISLATKETTTATQAQRNYREAATQVGLVFGQDSQVFKNFAAQVTVSTASLNEMQSSLRRNIAGVEGFAGAFKELGLSDVLRTQREEINSQLNQLKAEAQGLAAEYRKTGLVGQESFAHIGQQLKLNLEQQEQLKKSLLSLDSALHNTGTVGTQISNSIASGFNNVKSQLGQLLATYVGFQAAFQGAIQLLHTNEVLSDSFADLKIRIHGTTEDVDRLFESLKKIDTRTSLTGLVDIANVVAKKGVAQDQIAGITKSLDQLFVVLGKEAGDPHEATASLVKLISIFNDDKHVTAERVNEIGTSLFKLTTSGVATGSFLINFAERVGAVRGITGLTLPNILGMGAALQQLGQRTEVAGTAAVQLATKMFSNVPKFAEAAGQSVEQFKKLLADNPFAALVAVAENLKSSGKDFEEVNKSFGEVGISGARIKTVLADIATNGEFVKQKMAAAAVTTSDYGNQTAAAALKQNTFAATIERITKQFEILGTNKTVQNLLAGISSVVLILIGNLPILLTFFGILTISWAAQNASLLLLRAQLLGYNLLIGLSTIAQAALTVVNGLYVAGLFILNGAYTIVTRAASLFNLTLGRTPIGLILTGIGLLLTAYEAFGRTLSNGVAVLKGFNEQARINRDVTNEAAKASSEHRAQAQLLSNVIKDLSISETTRLTALQKLIAIDPAFQAALVNGKINYQELDKALSQYNISLIRSSELQAAQTRQSAEFKKLTDLQIQKQDIEFAISSKNFKSLTDEELDLVKAGREGGFSNSLRSLDTIAKLAVDNLNKDIEKQTKTIDAAQQVFNEKQKKVDEGIAASNAKAEAAASKTPPKIIPAEIDVDGLKKQIEEFDNQINAFKGSQKDLDKLIADRKKLQDQLDAALGKDKTTGATKTFRGSRLTGLERDDFKDIDAISNEQIEKQKLLFKQLTIDEETYLKNTLIINENAANQKIAVINKRPVAQQNSAEKLEITKLNIFKIEQEEETNKKLFDIRKQQLDAEFEDIKKRQELELATITDDPIKTEQEKLQAKQIFLVQEFILQKTYNETISALESKYNQNSIKGEQQRSSAILTDVKQLRKNRVDLEIGVLGQIQKLTDEDVARTKLKYDKLIETVLNSSKTLKEKNNAIANINLVANVEIGAVKLTGANKLKEAAQALFDAHLISAKQFEDIFNGANEAQKGLGEAIDKTKAKYTDLKSLVQGSLGKLFGFKEGSDEAKEMGIIITQAFDLAGQAMHNFFDQEQQRIERSKELNLKRLDIELQQAQKQAQSQGERDSLERQFQAKRDEENRKAFEKDKKLKKQQLTINYAIQLSNIAVAASANPLNAFTFGAAGIAQYIIQAAIATAAYFLNLGSINKAQYAFGGKVRKEDVNQLPNGRIISAQNIPTQPNGDNILATVKTGEVILNEDQQKKLGGAKTFRDIGVPGFAAGGSTGSTKDYDLFSIIDELRDSKIEKEKQSFKDLRIDETSYLRNIMKINEETASTKISFLQSDINRINTSSTGINQSSTDIQHRQIAELNIYKIEQETETNQQIFNIKKSWLDKHYESISLKSERALNLVADNQDISHSEKQRVRQNYITDTYVTMVLHDMQSSSLSKQYSQPNGLITTAPNIPTQANGDNIIATVKQGEVILNEDQQRKLGGARTFRAIGVPGFGGSKHKEISNYYTRAFASGGFTGLGDLKLGDSLQAPINPSSFLNPKANNNSGSEKTDEKLNKLIDMIAETSRQTNQRFDKLKVQVVTQEITNSQDKIKKATSIGTL